MPLPLWSYFKHVKKQIDGQGLKCFASRIVQVTGCEILGCPDNRRMMNGVDEGDLMRIIELAQPMRCTPDLMTSDTNPLHNSPKTNQREWKDRRIWIALSKYYGNQSRRLVTKLLLWSISVCATIMRFVRICWHYWVRANVKLNVRNGGSETT